MGQTCDKLTEIDAMELQVLLQLKENPPLLIDVRQPQEYVAGHIPGALLFPLGQVELARPQIAENRTVVVYCRSGKRSLVAAGILCRLGLTEVSSLEGGILGWHYELIKGPPKDILSSEDVKTVIDILLLAMEKELQARRVYTKELNHGHTTKLNNLLKTLAAREEVHLNSIYQRYVSWTEKYRQPQKPLEIIQEEISLQLEQQEAQGKSISFMSQEDLIELAVQQEFTAYDFYRTAAEQITDPELRGLLFDLSFEERKHAASLLELMPPLPVSPLQNNI